MIVILGLYRGGSSTVAGVLFHLGVCMGHELKVIPTTELEGPGYCTYEDWPLRRAFLRCYTEPQLEPLVDFDRRVSILREYMDRRIRGDDYKARPRSTKNTRIIQRLSCNCEPLAVKFPGLCAMGPEVVEAWDPLEICLRFVSVRRDHQVVEQSLRRWYPEDAGDLVDRLVRDRAAFLKHRAHVSIDYELLCRDPAGQIARLAEELGIYTTAERIQKAAAFVRRPGVRPLQESIS